MNKTDNNKKSMNHNQNKEEQMKIRCKTIMLAVLLIGAIAVMAPQSAMAVNTAAGQAITNAVTLDYQVSGVPQVQQTASVTFNVDRKIIFTVVADHKAGGTEKTVAPNSPAAATDNTNVIRFTINNAGNTQQFFNATMVDTNNFTGGGSVTYYWNTTGSLTYDAGHAVNNATAYTSGTAINSGVAAGGDLYVFAVVAVPGTATDTQTRDIQATVQSIVDGTTNTALTNGGAAGSGTAVVIAMGAGLDADNSVPDTGRYKVVSATLTVSKTYQVYSDGFNAYPNAKVIPGAVVTYIVTIANGASGASATSVVFNDDLSTEIGAGRIAYNTSYTGKMNDNATNITCVSPGVLVNDVCNTNASWAGNKVTVTNITVAPSSNVVIRYNVTIQ